MTLNTHARDVGLPSTVDTMSFSCGSAASRSPRRKGETQEREEKRGKLQNEDVRKRSKK